MISRAGASSIAETTVVGRPAILVPYPFAMDGHQLKNAQFVEDHGAGWIVEDHGIREGKLEALLLSLLSDPKKLADVAQKARQIGPHDAVDKFIALIEAETKTKTTVKG